MKILFSCASRSLSSGFARVAVTVSLVLATSGIALAQAPLPRKDILITEAWPAGTTFSNYNNLNPFSVGNDIRNHAVFLHEPLFYWLNMTGEVVPYLATGYRFNDSYTSVTVTLRDGPTWSDGRPFSADDVVFTFEMLRKNGNGKNNLIGAKDVSAVLKEAVKVDNRTVRFDLLARDPRFVLRMLTVKFNSGIFPVPKHIWEKVEDPSTFSNFDLEKGLPVATGPWRIAAAAPERITLDRRDNWWGGRPRAWGSQQGAFYTNLPEVKRIITIPRGDVQQAAQQLATGQVDWIVEAPVAVMKRLLAQSPKVTTLTDRKIPYGNVDWWTNALFFNHDAPAVADINVRKAILHTINAKQVVDIVHEGASELAYQPFPDFKVLRPYIEDLTAIAKEKGIQQTDPRKASQFMEMAGYKKDGQGFWAKDGKRWTSELHGSVALELMGPILAEQLRRGGFDVAWATRPDYNQFIAAGKATMVLSGHTGSIFDPEDTMLLYHSKFYRPVGEMAARWHRWKNAKFDALTDKVSLLPPNDPAIRPLVKEAFSIWMDEVVIVPIAQHYHRIPFSTANWIGWPSEANPYVPPTISAWTSPLVVHGLKRAAN